MYEFPAVAHFHGWFNGFEPRNPGKPILCSRNQRLNVYSGGDPNLLPGQVEPDGAPDEEIPKPECFRR